MENRTVLIDNINFEIEFYFMPDEGRGEYDITKICHKGSNFTEIMESYKNEIIEKLEEISQYEFFSRSNQADA